ncbi:MAG: Hsp20/alpha crystallin family protein [Clostridiaceae bacterium]|nr:Hsp20/alpha crystallin family protein [Clostridiaceae bacterium]
MSFMDLEPFRQMEDLACEVNDFIGNFPMSVINRYVTPRTDIYQTDKVIIIKSEVPGLSRDDMEVIVENTYVKLAGQKKRIQTMNNEEIYRSEQFYGRFSRIVPLPCEVQPDKAVAECKDGILTIIIPKSDSKTTHGRKIDIT